MSVVTENNKNHLLNYEGVESLLVKINDRFARTDRYATQDTLGMIKAEVNTDVNLEDINIPDTTGDNYPIQITTEGNAFVNIPEISGNPEASESDVYIIRDFDLLDICSGEDITNVDKSSIINAIDANKIICLPYDKSIISYGAFPLNIYAEDLMYITFIENNTVYHIETNYDDNTIYSNQITLTVLDNFNNVQSDWNETDNTSDAFIKNKPDLVTTTSDGLVPKADAAAGTINSSSSDWVLTNDNGTIGWYKLPANAFNNTNTVTSRMVSDCTSAADSTIKVMVSKQTVGTWYGIGSTIYVKFINGNTAVNTGGTTLVLTDNRGTTPLYVLYKNSPINENNPLNIPAGTVVCFVVTKAPTSSSNPGTAEVVGIYDENGNSSGDLPIASSTTLGGVKVGSGLSITEDGTLSSTATTNIAESTTAAWYYPTFVTGTSATTEYINSGFAVWAENATSTSLGDVTLTIGKAATDTVKAQNGYLRIHGESSRAILWGPTDTNAQEYVVKLPSEAGTLVVKDNSGSINCNYYKFTSAAIDAPGTESNFWKAIFGSSSPTSMQAIKTFRFNDSSNNTRSYNGDKTKLFGNYASSLIWTASDTFGYINMPYGSGTTNPIYIGGGNAAGTLGWSAKLLHDTMSLIPSTTETYNLGSSSLKWSNVYATTFNGNLIGNVTGNVTGNVSGSSGSCTGNAASATTVKIQSNNTVGYYPMVFTTSTTASSTASLCMDASGTTTSSSGIRYEPSNNRCYCSGGFYEASDERLKNFGDDIEVDLDKLSKLSKKYFTWKDDESNTQHIGVSAQEVQAIYPELVDVIDEDGHLSVSYDKLSVVALKGIDILNDKIKSLEERLERLEKLIEE